MRGFQIAAAIVLAELDNSDIGFSSTMLTFCIGSSYFFRLNGTDGNNIGSHTSTGPDRRGRTPDGQTTLASVATEGLFFLRPRFARSLELFVLGRDGLEIGTHLHNNVTPLLPCKK